MLSLKRTLSNLFLTSVLLCLTLLAKHGLTLAQSNDTSRNNLSVHISYCSDKRDLITVTDALDCTYLPENELPRKKFADAPAWIRITVLSHESETSSLAIKVGPHFLNQIDLYENIDGQWIKQSAGSRLGFDNSHATLGGYIFKVTRQKARSQTYYLQTKAYGLNVARIEVSDWNPGSLDQINQQLGMGIQLGALSLILAFSIVSYLANPNVLMFRFCWLMLNLLICTLAGSGILAKYIFYEWPRLDEVFFSWMLCLRMACWLWVSQAFLTPYTAPRWYLLSCKLTYLLVACSLVLSIYDEHLFTSGLILTGILALPVVQVIAVLQTPNIQRSFRLAMLSGFICSEALILIALVLAMLPTGNESFAIYFTRAVDFINPLVLLSILAIRNKMMHKEFEEVKTTNFQINLRLEFERKLLDERRTLIDMLTHELKNPLASISMAVGSLAQSLSSNQETEARRLHNIEQSIRSMDMVIERCSLMNQMDHKELKANTEKIIANEFIVELVKKMPGQQRIQLKLDPRIEIETDTYFFRIILLNLIENALKYSPSDSFVSVELFQSMKDSDLSITVTVSNQVGRQGMPALDSVFNRFYRNPLAMNTPGSGLGLYLVKEMSKALGGSVKYLPDATTVRLTVELPSQIT